MARIFNPNDKVSASMGAGLIVAILIVANGILYLTSLPYLDASPDKRHLLSQVTIDTIEEIDEYDPVVIDFYYTPDVVGLPREVKEAGREVLRILDLYQNSAGSRLDIRVHYPDPLSEDKEEQDLIDHALQQGIKRFEKYWNQNTAIVYCGLVVGRADRSYVFDNIDVEAIPQLEFRISAGISHCVSPEKKVLGIISGMDFRSREIRDQKGEMQEISGWPILSRLEEQFQVKFLERPSLEVKDCDVLMVIRPRGLSPDDLIAIERHVVQQGKGALFLEAPFSFQELILISQDLQRLKGEYDHTIELAIQNIIQEAENKLERTLQGHNEVYDLWKKLRSDEVHPRIKQYIMQQFYQKVMTEDELQKAFEEYQKTGERVNLIQRGRETPPEAERMRKKFDLRQSQKLPEGGVIFEKLLDRWGVHLAPKKLLFKPDPEVDANASQFLITIGGPNGNPRCFAENRLETQGMQGFYPSFAGVLEPYLKENSKVSYQPLIRADKEFSFFVPNPKANIDDWFALESFEKFLSSDPNREGERWQEWNKALNSRGDQLSGWYDVAVALEGDFDANYPENEVNSGDENYKPSRIIVVSSVDMLEISPGSEEDKSRQRSNHKFIMNCLTQLSLSPKVASLSRIGNETSRFVEFENLVRWAEEKAKQKRLELENDRDVKRREARARYETVLQKYPREKGQIMLGGLVLEAEFVPESQRIEMEKAERDLEQSLEGLKMEETKKIERIEYEVANATLRKKNSIRLWGTILSPFLILVLGVFALFWTRILKS